MTDQTAAIEVWARMLCAADVHVHGADHPTWQQTGSKIRDDYRKAAAWLLPRLTVAASSAGPAPAADRDGLLRVVARIRQMTDYWEQQLPEVIRTPAVVSAIRAALEPAAVLPAPTDQTAAVCICGHTEAQHFEDVCITEITGCDCGDFLVPEAACEVIDRWREAAMRKTADRAAVLLEAADAVAALDPVEAALAGEHAWQDAAAVLRRMAGEAQQDEAPCCSDPTCACDMVNAAGRCECAKWDDAPAREAQQDPTQDGTCGAREPEPRTGTSPCVLPSGHGGVRHQDKWTNQWPAVARPGQPETEAAAPPA